MPPLAGTSSGLTGGGHGRVGGASAAAEGGAAVPGLHSAVRDGTALTRHGASTVDGSGVFLMKDGASVTNLGSLAADVESSYFEVYGAGTFSNQGSVTKTGAGELDDDVGANESCAPGYQNCVGHGLNATRFCRRAWMVVWRKPAAPTTASRGRVYTQRDARKKAGHDARRS